MPDILTLSSGSPILKACLFRVDGTRRDWRYEPFGQGFPRDHAEAFDTRLKDLRGEVVDAARILDAAEIERLRGITPLAPLHMPGNLLSAVAAQTK